MNDTLEYISEDPVHRKYHHDKMTFGLVYAFTENFVLPLSHDEVVHGKRSILGRMPGDEWQRFANLRAYYACMYAHPGKKLLFMGAEIAQHQEWSHDRSLDWHLLEYPNHSGVQKLICDLNEIYRSTPALYENDFSGDGFEWVDWDDRDNSILSWIRRDRSGGYVICITNFTPIVRYDYRIGVSEKRPFEEIMNTDADVFGGSGTGNGELLPDDIGHRGKPHALSVTIPPLATLILKPRDGEG